MWNGRRSGRAANSIARMRPRSSGCTPSHQPKPISCSSVRPVKSSQGLLKYVTCAFSSSSQIMTGRRVGHEAEALLALADGILGLAALGDVDAEPMKPSNSPAAVKRGIAVSSIQR